MKHIRFNILLLILMLNAFCHGALNAQTLIWSDEFNYYGLPDTSKWGNEIGYIRNNELQYYTNRIENQIVRNGNLEITAVKETYKGYSYTSASINTLKKTSWKYGRIEARMKFSMDQGIWPAFWMLGRNVNEVGWPKCGEIDIMEHINNEEIAYGTLHWANEENHSHVQNQGFSTIDVTKFHTYSIIWNADSIAWYIDNRQYHKVIISGGINGTEEIHKPHYILFNLAVGGDWPGRPDSTTVFPAKLFVDYVRVYSLE
jgi:beta-glucanase (GH16 family)